MSLQKSPELQQNVCIVRPPEYFSLNLQDFVHLISALSSLLSVEEDRKKDILLRARIQPHSRVFWDGQRFQ